MKRILLVDDQAHVLRVMKLSLDRNGFEVDTALSGEVALSMLHTDRYDVVITDVEMPIMNGRQLCEAMQRDFGEESPLVFVVSSDDEAKNTEWVEALPKTELVKKPMSLRWLVSRLNGYFGHYGQVANG